MHSTVRWRWTALAALAVMPITSSAQSPPITAAAPAPAVAMAAFEELRALVLTVSLPPEGSFERFDSAGPVGITLRLDGLVIARATSTVRNAMRDAATQAIRLESQRLGRPRDALQSSSAPPDAARVTISLELAGALVPFSPRTYADFDAEISPGIEGVGVGIGAVTELVFPGTTLALNMMPSEAAAMAVATGAQEPALGVPGNPEAEPAKLSAARGFRFYRFRVTHLAQTGPGEPPIFLSRGGRVVRERDLSTRSLREFADSMARNLIDRRVKEPGNAWPGRALSGTPTPTIARTDEGYATPFEHALAALSLAHYAELAGAGRADAARARAYELLAVLAAQDAADTGAARGSKIERFSIATSALASAAVPDRADLSNAPPEIRAPIAVFLATCDARLNSAGDDLDGVVAAERPVLAYALAINAERSRDPPDLTRAERVLGAVLSQTPPGQLVSHMPWLGWADMTLASVKGGPISSVNSLLEMRDAVYAHALTEESAGIDNADLVGGVVFTTTGLPLPTWHTARPIALIATMLGDPRCTPIDARVREQARLLPTLRFLRQLGLDEAVGHMCVDPRARGGIRTTLWDQRQPADATSITLLAVCETLRSLSTK